jgi:serine/threonine-protein kinase
MRLGREASERALAIEPNLAEGHTALGLVRHWGEFDWAGAEASLARALELAPGSADALQAVGMLEYCLGRFDRALELMRRAIDADPLSMIGPSYVARILYSAGRMKEAESELRATLARTTSPAREHAQLAFVYLAEGRLDEALAEATAEPSEWARLWALAIVDWKLGRTAESDEAVALLELKYGDTAAFQVAQVRAHRGETDAAFAWLDRSLEIRDAGVALSRVSPHLRTLHGDPRWTAFLRKIGLES